MPTGPCAAPGERRLGWDSIQLRSHTTARPQRSSVVEHRAEELEPGSRGAHPQDWGTQPDVLGVLYSYEKSEVRWGSKRRQEIIWEREREEEKGRRENPNNFTDYHQICSKRQNDTL